MVESINVGDVTAAFGWKTIIVIATEIVCFQIAAGHSSEMMRCFEIIVVVSSGNINISDLTLSRFDVCLNIDSVWTLSFNILQLSTTSTLTISEMTNVMSSLVFLNHYLERFDIQGLQRTIFSISLSLNRQLSFMWQCYIGRNKFRPKSCHRIQWFDVIFTFVVKQKSHQTKH